MGRLTAMAARADVFFFREIQHSNISPSASLLITYTRITHASVSLKVTEASCQTLYMQRLNSNTKNYFRSVQILRELIRIATIDAPNAQRYKQSYKQKV